MHLLHIIDEWRAYTLSVTTCVTWWLAKLTRVCWSFVQGTCWGKKLEVCAQSQIEISSYTLLCLSYNVGSYAAASAFGKWITRFAGMNWLVGYQGSHFKALLVKRVADHMYIEHRFTIEYCTCSSGTIEHVCKEVIHKLRKLLSARRLSTSQWPAMLDTIQKIIKHLSTERLGSDENGNKWYSMEVFLGSKPSLPLVRPRPLPWYRKIKNINEECCRQIANMERTHTAHNRCIMMYPTAKKDEDRKPRRPTTLGLMSYTSTSVWTSLLWYVSIPSKTKNYNQCGAVQWRYSNPKPVLCLPLKTY